MVLHGVTNDKFRERTGEQKGLLRYEGDASTDEGGRQSGDVLPSDQDRALRRRVETGEQAGQR